MLSSSLFQRRIPHPRQLQTVPIPEPQAAPGTSSIPGRDLAGVVDAVGPHAGGWRPVNGCSFRVGPMVRGSPSRDALLHALGADEIVDYHGAHFEDALRNFDVVLNTVDADTNVRSIAMVKPGGILVSVVGAPPAAQCAAAQIHRSQTVSCQDRATIDAQRGRESLGAEPQRSYRWQIILEVSH
jgi:NADPH:quinone reductase-like Zn-dependent oxidoreductase